MAHLFGIPDVVLHEVQDGLALAAHGPKAHPILHCKLSERDLCPLAALRLFLKDFVHLLMKDAGAAMQCMSGGTTEELWY